MNYAQLNQQNKAMEATNKRLKAIIAKLVKACDDVSTEYGLEYNCYKPYCKVCAMDRLVEEAKELL